MVKLFCTYFLVFFLAAILLNLAFEMLEQQMVISIIVGSLIFAGLLTYVEKRKSN